MVWCLAACSTDRKGFPSKQWHNLNSQYNSYFLADQKLIEAEEKLRESNKDNYNRILEVYPQISQAQEGSIAPMLSEAIKKASIPIQKHKNSDWVDDCYIAIGKARFYKTEDYDNAVKTFTYVNSKSEDPDARHEALIWLVRTFVKGKNYNLAKVAKDYLAKQPMTKRNLRDYYLVSAHYHQQLREYKEMAYFMEKAMPFFFWPTDTKARYLYIMGQLKQRFGEDSASYAYYRRCIRNNPTYEMSFYAKTNLAQVLKIEDPKQVRKVRRYFDNLLTDKKNEEYLDKIYYELGGFELKLKNEPSAISNYKTSVKKSKNNNVKSYSYLRIGEILYDRQREWAKAKLYYDSTMTILDTLDEHYLRIQKRHKVLVDFVKEWDIIIKSDTLSAMASMDTTTLYKKIDDANIAEARAAFIAAKEAEKKARREALANATKQTQSGEADNPVLLAQAQANVRPGRSVLLEPSMQKIGLSQFKKRWGDRPLEDHWRRSKKELQLADADSVKPSNAADTAKSPEAKAAVAKAEEAKKEEAKKEADRTSAKFEPTEQNPLSPEEIVSLRNKKLAEIPRGATAQKEGSDKLQVAVFNIAKIFEQRMNEPGEGENYFKRLIANHYTYERVPEAMYFLYLMYGRQNRQQDQVAIRNRLVKEFPESDYARLVDNPNYLQESAIVSGIVAKRYNKIYDMFMNKNFVEAQTEIDEVNKTYPYHKYKDLFAMLKVMMLPQTTDLATYKTALDSFVLAYPKSRLVPFAYSLDKARSTFIGKKLGGRSDSASAINALSTGQQTPFSMEIEGSQIFMMAVPIGMIKEDQIKAQISDWNAKYYPLETFTISSLLLNNQTQLITVREFESKVQGLNYLKKIMGEKTPIKDWDKQGIKMFVISPNNFQLLYKHKRVDDYMKFFEKQYDMSEL